jgi:hypothetical protein
VKRLYCVDGTQLKEGGGKPRFKAKKDCGDTCDSANPKTTASHVYEYNEVTKPLRQTTLYPAFDEPTLGKAVRPTR